MSRTFDFSVPLDPSVFTRLPQAASYTWDSSWKTEGGLLKPDGNHNNNHLVVECQTNGTVSVTLVNHDIEAGEGLLFRGSSTEDYCLLERAGDVVQVADGIEVSRAATGVTFTSGDEMRVDLSYSYCQVFKNGVDVFDFYMSGSMFRDGNMMGVLANIGVLSDPAATTWDNLTVPDGFPPCDPPVTPLANCKWNPFYGVMGGSDESGAYAAPSQNWATLGGRPYLVLSPYGPNYAGSTHDWVDQQNGWWSESAPVPPNQGNAISGNTPYVPDTGATPADAGVVNCQLAYRPDLFPNPYQGAPWYDDPTPNQHIEVVLTNPGSFGFHFGAGDADSYIAVEWWARPFAGGPAIQVDAQDRIWYGFANESYSMASDMPSGYAFDHLKVYRGSVVSGPVGVVLDWWPSRHPLRPVPWPSGFPYRTRGHGSDPWFNGWTPESNGIWRIEADDTLTRVVDFGSRIVNCWGVCTAKWEVRERGTTNRWRMSVTPNSGGGAATVPGGVLRWTLTRPDSTKHVVVYDSDGAQSNIPPIYFTGSMDHLIDGTWDDTIDRTLRYYEHTGPWFGDEPSLLADGGVLKLEVKYHSGGYVAWDDDQWVEIGDSRFSDAPLNWWASILYYSGPRAFDRHGEIGFFEGDGSAIISLKNSRSVIWIKNSDPTLALQRADASVYVDLRTVFDGTYDRDGAVSFSNAWEDADGVWLAFARQSGSGPIYSRPTDFIFARYSSLEDGATPDVVRTRAGEIGSRVADGTCMYIDDTDDLFLAASPPGGVGQIVHISKSTGVQTVEFDETTYAGPFPYPYQYQPSFFRWNGRMSTDNYFENFLVRQDDGSWEFEPNNPEGPDVVPSNIDFDFLRIAAVTPDKIYALCYDDESFIFGFGGVVNDPPIGWGLNPDFKGTITHGLTAYYHSNQYPVFLARLGSAAPPVPSVASRKISRVEPLVWTSKPDADSTDRVYLDSLGLVKDLKYGHAFPGGSKALSGTLLVPAGYSHRALTPGRELGVTVGAEDVWHGELSLCPISDDGSRTLVGIGDMAVAGDFVALGLASHNALNPNEIVDAAGLSGRHARFRRADVYPMPPGQYAQDGSLMLDEALTQSATATGNRWRIDRDRVVRFYPLAGDGTRWLLRARHDVDRTTEGMATRISGAYVDALTGLYNVEHYDSPYELTGGTQYPDFYNAARTAYSQRNFTLYSDGVKTWAYVMQAPPTATLMYLSTGQILDRIENSQFYSRWEGPTPASLGTGGRTANYKAVVGGPSLGTGPQNGITHRGHGSLHATEFISPKEVVVDLTGQGSFSKAEVLDQLKAALEKMQAVPHYSGGFTAAPGDLVTMGGVPCDLASVQAGCVVTVLVLDPTRNMALQADELEVLIGETEYDVETNVLTLTPYADESSKTQPPRYIDPLTGLYR